MLLVSINTCLWGQNFKQAKKKPLEQKDRIVQKDSINKLSQISLPDRTKAKPATKELWKPLPQFQVEQNFIPRWYALENADNPTYWQGVKTDRILICLKKGKTEIDIKFLIDKYSLKPTKDKSMFIEIMNFFVYEIPNASKEKMLEIISAAKAIDFIEFAEPDMIIESQTCNPNDPYYSSNQWGPHNIWADSAWCYETGTNTWEVIGIIDNACDYYHSDLYNTVWYGYDFADGDNDPIPINTSVNHGTHVSGISSGKIDNGTGISGMANDTVFFAKVTTDADPLLYNYTAVINAINYFSTEPRIRVINMSFGGTSINAALQTACDNAWNNGKLLIAAAGNVAQSGNPINYPAAFSSVVAVGAVDVNNNWSTYSSYGTYVEVSAPGGDGSNGAGDIYSTLPNNSYGYMFGTSMASPLVTGLAGLMFAANPSITNSQARTILQQCVFDFGATGWDQYYGYGVVCAYCAVMAAIITSVDEITDYSEINISPNPANDVININLPAYFSEDKTTFELFDINGKLLKSLSIQGNQTQINISELPSGVYIIKVTDNKGVAVKKFAKN